MITTEISGGDVGGNISADVFRVGDLVVNNFTFGEIKKIGGNDYVFKKQNGAIGLAYKSMNTSVSGSDPFLHLANPADKSFSLYFQNSPKESYMWVPGMDTDNFEIIKTHKVVDQLAFQMKLDSIKYGDKIVKEEGNMTVGIFNNYDNILGSRQIIDPLLDNVVVYKDCSNLDELPDLTLTLDGVDYTLTAHDYVIKHLGNCVNGIIPYDHY